MGTTCIQKRVVVSCRWLSGRLSLTESSEVPSDTWPKLGGEVLEPTRQNLLNLIPPLVLILWTRQMNGWFVGLLV